MTMSDPGTTGLQTGMVDQPRHSRLSMMVTETGVDVVVASKVVDGSLIYRHIDFDRGATSVIHAFEDAVYDNPLLLADFETVDVLIDTRRFLVIPADRADDAEEMLADLYPDTPFECLLSPTGAGDSAKTEPLIATAANPELLGFLRRTFHNANIAHRLSPLCAFFGAQRNQGNMGKLHLNLHNGRTDILAFVPGGLLMANTVDTPKTTDTAYYILAAAQSLGFDAANDRVIVSGDNDQREELLPILRRHVSFVMPHIFPSEALKSGRDAMAAPFELIVIPLIK